MPLPEPLPDVVVLDLVTTVGEAGSISAAARAHGMSQPAASMRLRALESSLGLRLLERTPGGSRLTAAGQAVVEWAAPVLAGMRALQSGAAALRAGEKGAQLRLGASLTVAEYLIPGWLRRLSAALPDASVALEMGNSAHIIELVASGTVELGFIESPAPPRGLRTRTLFTDALAVVVAPGHPWSHRRRPVGATELAGTPLLLREPGSGTRDTLRAALAREGLEVRPLMELASTTALKAAAAAGGAPAVLSALAVASEVRAGQLVAVPCEVSLDRPLRAVWRGDVPLRPVAARLLLLAAEPS